MTIRRQHFDHLARWIADNTEHGTERRYLALQITLNFCHKFGKNFDDDRFIQTVHRLDRERADREDLLRREVL